MASFNPFIARLATWSLKLVAPANWCERHRGRVERHGRAYTPVLAYWYRRTGTGVLANWYRLARVRTQSSATAVIRRGNTPSIRRLQAAR